MTKPVKILLIRFGSIGDVVLLASAVHALREQFPAADIHLLTKKAMAPLWAGDGRIQVRSFDPESAHFGLPGFVRFLRELRAERYDWVVDLHAIPKSRALTAFLGRQTSRYDKAALARRRYVLTKKPPHETVHVARRYLKALTPLGVSADAPLQPALGVSERNRARVGSMLEGLGLRGRVLVGLAPGAQWPTKQWGWARYAELAERLHRRGHWIAFVGGKAERDACEEMAQGKNALNFAGLLDVGETLALMEFCHVVVTNDSGPMHMASARGAAVIAIFGSTTPALGFTPLAADASVLEVEGLACRPCSPHGRASCPQGHFKCMADLSLESVWAEVERRLGPPPGDNPEPPDEGLFILSD